MSDGGFFGFVIIIWGLAVTLAWLLIGWRAMQAHESVARSLERLAARQERPSA